MISNQGLFWKNMKKTFIGIAISLITLSAFATEGVPDPVRTPGSINPDVTQGNIHETICKSNWTKTIRPPVSYTNRLKLKQMTELDLTGKASDYEEDHLISLELGGHPTDPKNLWPEPWEGEWGARKKDVIETYLKNQVCSGKMTLIDAQHFIATNWVETYKQFIKPKK
jgi:hypothetical protein